MNDVATWKPTEIQNLAKLAKRTEMVQEDIPTRNLNGAEVPLGYIDSTALATLSGSDDPAAAIVPMSFQEGFPTVNGTPFWERLENETLEQFSLFQSYRNMDATEGRRSVAKLAERTGIQPAALNTLSKLWHWTTRVKSYDMFKVLEREYIRQHEVRRIENKHAKAAEKIFDMCTDFLDTHKGELTPQVALTWFKTAAELQRLSLGLSRDKPQGADSVGPGVTINIDSTSNGPSLSSDGGKKQDETRIMEILSVLKQTGALNQSPNPTQPNFEIIDAEGYEEEPGSEGEVIDIGINHRGTEKA